MTRTRIKTAVTAALCALALTATQAAPAQAALTADEVCQWVANATYSDALGRFRAHGSFDYYLYWTYQKRSVTHDAGWNYYGYCRISHFAEFGAPSMPGSCTYDGWLNEYAGGRRAGSWQPVFCNWP